MGQHHRRVAEAVAAAGAFVNDGSEQEGSVKQASAAEASAGASMLQASAKEGSAAGVSGKAS